MTACTDDDDDDDNDVCELYYCTVLYRWRVSWELY